ncbi:outer membrane protein [Methylorubrum zatmanii]|uniref:Outer membrane protein n=1 Tax=Methylorubrum zatmanii TaxID=29429 RepID=A0ABW1WQA6_9HYPH|nr:outer membrane beta-barrel protein [Methylorubrum zatmanii]MBD8906607.1 porin [Methylorubrum zatmanii]
MSRRSKLPALARSLTLLAGVGVPCLAHAADLLPPPPPQAVIPEPVEFAGGWYLRVDGGYGSLDLRKTIAEDVSHPPKPYDYVTLQDKVSNQYFVGGGVGYQVNPWLRIDATGEYRFRTKWKLFAEDRTGGDTGGYNATEGRFDSIVGLVNGYVDLGTWYGVTPFLGAGVGVAHHSFGGVTDKGYGNYDGGYGIGSRNERTNFAWALHAGLGYDVTQNLKFEVAYRYLNMGEATTGVVTCSLECPKTVYRVKDLDSHDVKVGLRYLLGGPVAVAAVDYAPPPPMAPLVRKY